MASKYTNEDITVLDDLEHMRLRRGMYIGEADNPKQLISEIIDNALDEVQEGYSDELIVTVNTKDNITQDTPLFLVGCYTKDEVLILNPPLNKEPVPLS